MIELGATYSIVGPDGTEAVFNDSTHPNFVGWLREITGLDSPEVRLEVAPMGGADGAYLTSPGYYGARAVTLSGVLAPSNAADVNRLEEKLRRATDALRGDSILSWWPAGQNEMQLFCRRNEALRITPGRPRQFQISLVAPDPRIYSVEQVTRIVTYDEDPSMSLTLGNAGTAYAPVVINLTGPFNLPDIELINRVSSTSTVTSVAASAGIVTLTTRENHGLSAGQTIVVSGVDENVDGQHTVTSVTQTTVRFSRGSVTIAEQETLGTVFASTAGQMLSLGVLLGDGETLRIDTAKRTIEGPGGNLYHKLDFEVSSWWSLPPQEASVVRAFGSPFPKSQLRIDYRHAWI